MIGGRNSVKFLYCGSTWNEEHFTYEPKPVKYMGVSAPNVL